ncbi:hypothetical protein [Variovorax sp. WS11]|uniref:hypothetical protein n=1 Tax=Variovorax sp. WS11 TaxID=1105204 RepID=UPI001EF229E3|nr:hypothetical protein [Variovorax sp. WS11]
MTAHVLHIGFEALHLAQHALRATVEDLSRFGRRDASHRAREQSNAKLAFEVRELLAQRGLRNVEVARRARQAAEFDDPNKVPQLADFHPDHLCKGNAWALLPSDEG